MLNDRDTLGVSDINDNYFYEPTLSLKFISGLQFGCFSVLRVPTMSNDFFRWMFFVSPPFRETEIHHYTCDVSSDGLFDLRGRVYYSCSNNHNKVFSTESGQCTAKDCGKTMAPLLPLGSTSDRAVVLGSPGGSTYLHLTHDFQLISPELPKGATIEAWINPSDVENSAGSLCTLFGMKGPSVVLDENMKLALSDPNDPNAILWNSNLSVKKAEWNHVALVIDGKKNIKLIVNDEISTSYALDASSMILKRIGSRDPPTKSDYRGSIDEIRIWSYGLDPKTITSNKNSTPIGTEALLAACWHCDEGEGAIVHDSISTVNYLALYPKPSKDCGWTVSQAPVRRNTGLTKSVLRLNNTVNIVGGISAGIYFEQVSFSAAATKEKESKANSEPNTSSSKEDKPLKRNARILVCAVAAMRIVPNDRLLLLDFGLLSDGTLGGVPSEIRVPDVYLDEKEMKAPTDLLFTDPEGTELFGALLALKEAYTARTPPHIWETATGGITIYFQTGDKMFGALPYNTSRSITVDLSTKLGVSKPGEEEKIMAAGKLRAAGSIKISTEACFWADPETVLSLSFSPTKLDKSTISEQWKGKLPRHVTLLQCISCVRKLLIL